MMISLALIYLELADAGVVPLRPVLIIVAAAVIALALLAMQGVPLWKRLSQ